MCTQQTTEICNQLAAQAIELAMAEQREATIAAALALPEADRYRLWFLLGKQFDTEFDFTPVYPESEWPQPEGTTIRGIV